MRKSKLLAGASSGMIGSNNFHRDNERNELIRARYAGMTDAVVSGRMPLQIKPRQLGKTAEIVEDLKRLKAAEKIREDILEEAIAADITGFLIREETLAGYDGDGDPIHIDTSHVR